MTNSITRRSVLKTILWALASIPFAGVLCGEASIVGRGFTNIEADPAGGGLAWDKSAYDKSRTRERLYVEVP